MPTAAAFRKRFESPILLAREPWSTEAQKKTAEEASSELSNIVNQFILRRTNTLLSKHLPPKLMQVRVRCGGRFKLESVAEVIVLLHVHGSLYLVM